MDLSGAKTISGTAEMGTSMEGPGTHEYTWGTPHRVAVPEEKRPPHPQEQPPASSSPGMGRQCRRNRNAPRPPPAVARADGGPGSLIAPGHLGRPRPGLLLGETITRWDESKRRRWGTGTSCGAAPAPAPRHAPGLDAALIPRIPPAAGPAPYI